MRKQYRRFIIRLRRRILSHLVEERKQAYMKATKEAREKSERITSFENALKFSDVGLILALEDENNR